MDLDIESDVDIYTTANATLGNAHHLVVFFRIMEPTMQILVLEVMV